MQRYHRLLIFLSLFVCGVAHANGIFIDVLQWRVTETNDWVYVNSLTVPNQTLDYRSIQFNYRPGVRVGASYESNDNDLLFAYTHYYAAASDSTSGNLQPSFIGSVTAKPSHAYLYSSGQVQQKITYNIMDIDLGHRFSPTKVITLHLFIGMIGGWIDQTIKTEYQGSTSSNEKLVNNFKGFGPKFGIDADIKLFNYGNCQPVVFASFAASYLLGYWNISDTTQVVPAHTVNVLSSNPRMGALTLQGAMGFRLDYKQAQIKLLYEINDWRDQNQFFDNDTGAHNNDLILQGLTLGFNVNFG